MEALSIAPVVYRWQSFPWFEQRSTEAARRDNEDVATSDDHDDYADGEDGMDEVTRLMAAHRQQVMEAAEEDIDVKIDAWSTKVDALKVKIATPPEWIEQGRANF